MRGIVIAGLLAVLLAGCGTRGEAPRSAGEERAELHTRLGARYLYRRQNEIALKELELALSLEPQNPQANYTMALLRTQMKQFDEAEDRYERALDYKPDYSEAHHNYAVLLCARGQYKKAIRHFSTALGDGQYSGVAMANFDVAQCMLGQSDPDYGKAQRYLEATLRRDPRQPGALGAMARVRYETGGFLSARAFIERYFAVARETPATLLLAVRIELALGDTEAGAQYARRLRTHFPKSTEARNLIDVIRTMR